MFCGARDRVSIGKLGQDQHNGTQKPGLSLAITAYVYSTLDAEVRGTLAQVKALLNDGTPARNIVVVPREEVAYGPKLIDIAWEYGVPLRALYQTLLIYSFRSTGRPLTQPGLMNPLPMPTITPFAPGKKLRSRRRHPSTNCPVPYRCKAHLETGQYPVQPDTERKACAYWDFDALCRQGNRLSCKEMTHGTD